MACSVVMSSGLQLMRQFRSPSARYFACLRFDEVAVLQGTPLLGAMLALPGHGFDQIPALAVLAVANFCLVAHVFVLNDWANVVADHADPERAPRVFTARGVSRGEMRTLALGLLAAGLILLGTLGRTPLLGAGVAVMSALYSLPRSAWKGRPVLSSIAHLVGGILHFLIGYSLAGAIDVRGVAAAVFFGLTFAAGHLTQELRDYRVDRQNGIFTNAVYFGPRRALQASVTLFGLAQLVLAALAFTGVVPQVVAAAALLFPLHVRWAVRAAADDFSVTSVRRMQARYRALHAVIGVVMVAALLFA
jgi:4-hydroxybenzoate polyprenyltransferase